MSIVGYWVLIAGFGPGFVDLDTITTHDGETVLTGSPAFVCAVDSTYRPGELDYVVVRDASSTYPARVVASAGRRIQGAASDDRVAILVDGKPARFWSDVDIRTDSVGVSLLRALLDEDETIPQDKVLVAQDLRVLGRHADERVGSFTLDERTPLILVDSASIMGRVAAYPIVSVPDSPPAADARPLSWR